MSMRWYIVHAYSNFEKKVADPFASRPSSADWKICSSRCWFRPKRSRVRRGRKIDAERKFFPGYVLVKMNLTDEAFHLIKNTPKVTGFLGAENKPMPISEAEAMRILSGAGRRGAAEAVGVVRDRREGARGRWSVRLVLRRGRGNRRGAVARQGRSVDLRSSTPVELEFGQVEKVA
jgi:transcriptional antiterminator NusG